MASPHDAVAVLRPNQTLTIDDFPFRKLEEPFDNRSALVRDSRLVAGSAGIVRTSSIANGVQTGSRP